MNKLSLAVAAALCLCSCEPQNTTPEQAKQQACAQAKARVWQELEKLFSVYDSCLNGRGHILPARERFCFDEGLDTAAKNMHDKCGESIGNDEVARCLSVALRDCGEVIKKIQPDVDRCKATVAEVARFERQLANNAAADTDFVDNAEQLVRNLDVDCVNNPSVPFEELKDDAARRALELARAVKDRVVRKMVFDHLGQPE